MERVLGRKDDPKFECLSHEYVVRWDYRESNEGETTYKEVKFLYRPSLETIKNIILDIENKIIDKKIREGFVWKEMSVWLSSENQFNYKAAYDIAIQTSGASLPIIFKFGTTENPSYYTFQEIQDLTDFYLKAMNYINSTLSEGWAIKDSIPWEEYEEALKVYE